MECTSEYILKYDEINLLANLAESTSENVTLGHRNTMCKSGLVLLCGYFEGFLREACKEFVNKINDSEIQAKTLPNSILSEHAILCLEKYKQQKRDLFDEFTKALADAESVELNSDYLSATNANPTVDNIEHLFNVFGIPLILDIITIEDYSFDNMYNEESQINQTMLTGIISAVSDNTTAKNIIIAEIEKKWKPKRKRRRIGYIGFIDELLKRRNRIAHGEGDEIVTPEELKKAATTITALSNSLVNKLDSKLQELLAHA